MKVALVTFLYILNSSILQADEIKCSGFNAPSTPSSLENFVNDCGIQKNLANNPEVKEDHRKKVYLKLAEKLATQIKQNSENISMLTNFYNANGQDLMMNSKEIANNCRLDSMKTIENCGGKKTGPLQNFKLETLKGMLPKNGNTPFANDQSLYGIMAGKFYSDLGINDKEKGLQCPLSGTSGSFILNSQITELSAEEILQNVNSNGVNNQIFEKYPQLKIIQSTKDQKFVEKFLNYLRSKPANSSSKEYIANFFFNSENQQKLAPTLAAQCGQINQNLNEFLCSDVTELGSLDDNVSKSLFNKLNTTEPMEDQYEVDFSTPTKPNEPSVLTAYGLQCLAKEKKLAQANGSSPNTNEVSIDNWYTDFTANIREENSEQASQILVDNFCATYMCKTAESKNQNSCKQGGPLSASDLALSLGCNKSGNNSCSPNSLKAITYMENLEKLTKDSKDQVIASSTNSSTNNSSNSKEEKMVSGRLPNFASNYFGVEGSLKALGKPVTAFEISEKKQEFKESKLATNDPVYSTPAVMKTQKQIEPSTAAVMTESSVKPTYTPTQASQPSARTVAMTNSQNIDNSPTATSKTVAKKPVEVESNSESSRLRDEMEKMIADIKSTKSEIAGVEENMRPTETAARSQSNLTTNSGSSPNYVNRAEQERLKRLEQSLVDKERRLEEYRRELDNRNYAQNSNPSTDSQSRSGTGSAASGASGSTGGGGSSGSTGSGGAVKLSAGGSAKADAKGSASNTAALIQSGVESSTLSVDELSRLSPDNLKKLGIDSSKPFTLKVTFESKTYEVPVKSFVYRGSTILGPVMDPRNKELNDFLLKSPLFKQYIDYKFERENKQVQAY